MARSFYAGANVNSTTGTFATWLERTNQIVYDMSDVVVTVADVTEANSTNGSQTTGNAHIDGYFSANVLIATQYLRGGKNNEFANSDVLYISSNTEIGNGGSDTLIVHGDATFNANVVLGSNTSDVVSFNAYVNTAIIPEASDQRDLGTSNLEWSKLFVDDIEATGNVHITSDSNGTHGYLSIGAGQDLQIHHDGTDSYINNSNTSGELYIQSEGITLRNTSNTENYFTADVNGAVTLYYNDASKLATKTDGVDITGELQSDSLDVDGVWDITGIGNLHANTHWDDNAKLLIGGGNDLQIYHDGNNSYINDTGTGNLLIRAADSFLLQDTGGKTYLKTVINNQTELYHNNVKKFETTSDGISVTGDASISGNLTVTGDTTISGNLTFGDATTDSITFNADVDSDITPDDDSTYNLGNTSIYWANIYVDNVEAATGDFSGAVDIDGVLTLQNNLDMQDNDKILLGDSDDLQLYHDGSHSYIQDNGTGELRIKTNGNIIQLLDGSNNYLIRASVGADVGLYYNTAQKLATKSDGVDITGELQSDSLDVDGNGDISGDLNIGGDLTVTGDTTISGNLTFGDAATDSINFSADIHSDIIPNASDTYSLGSSGQKWEDIYVDDVIADTGSFATSLSGGITSLANTEITGTLDVSGNTIIGNTTSTDSNFIVYGDLSVVGGSVTLPSDVSISANSTTTNHLTVQSSFTSQGSTDIGDSADDTLTVNALVDSNFSPSANSTYTLGTTLKRWDHLYIDDATVTNNITVANNIIITGTVDGRDLSVDGTKLDGIESGATADQTASEILTAIKTVDGTGTGLDADLLDGIQGSSYLRSDATDTASGVITFSNTTDSSSTTTGAVKITGGLGVAKTIYAKDINVTNNVTSSNNITAVTFTGDLTGNVTGDVTGDVTGNADTATALSANVNIALSGDVAGSASFDGSAGITIATTIQADSVALGTDTTGNYVATIAGTANEISVSDSGSESAAVTIGLPNEVTIADLTISGNLTVSGTTTTVSTTNTVISDNLIELNTGAASNASNDLGIVMERGSTGDNAFMGWDESEDKFIVGTTTATGSSTGALTITKGTLQANIDGNVTGNAGTATTLENARNFSLTGDVTAPTVSFNGSSAVALSTTLSNSGVTAATYGSSTAIPQITVDAKGRITSATTASIVTDLDIAGDAGANTVSLGSETLTVSGGTELASSVSGTTITINHSDVTRTNTANTASPTYGDSFIAIDDITTNARGHVTGVRTSTITLPADTNTNTTYGISAVDSGNDAIIRLTDSGAGTDDVKLVAGTNIALTPSGDNITVAVTGTVANAANADTVDSLHASSFLRSDASTTKSSGELKFNDDIHLQLGSSGTTDSYRTWSSGGYLYEYINGIYYIDVDGDNDIYIRDYNSTQAVRFTFDVSDGNFTASGNVTAYSDKRIKENLEIIPDAIEKVKQINGYTYDRTDVKTDKRQTGVIAQEVLEVLPEVVEYNEKEDRYTVAYGNMVGLLIEAIKEQQKQIDELKAKLEK